MLMYEGKLGWVYVTQFDRVVIFLTCVTSGGGGKEGSHF